MTFQPVIPSGGYAGWMFLNRTLDRQQATHAEAAPIKRATAYFRDNIAKATTAEALVSDRRLLEVALTAFGLEADIDARAFVKKVLDDGTIDSSALSARLADKRYAQFAFAFGYGNLGPRVNLTGFAEDIIARYESRSFESAVGAQDGALRQVLNLDSALGDILSTTSGTAARWFSLMGNPSLRDMFETALGLPDTFGTLDIDMQLATFRDRASSVLGTDDLSAFADDPQREKLIRLFLIRSDIASGQASYSPARLALTLLQS